MTIAYVVHELPERLRIRLPEHRNESGFFSALAEQIRQLEGVETVRTDALTASILIEHRTTEDALRASLSAEVGLELSSQPNRARYSLAPVTAAFSAINKRLRNASDGSTDLQAILFVVVVAIAIRQIIRGQIMVPAVSLLWYAFELAVRSRHKSQGDN